MGSSFLASGGVVSPPKGPKPLACRPAVPAEPAVSALKPHLPKGHKNAPGVKSYRRRQSDEAAEGFDTCMRRQSEVLETLCSAGLEDLTTAVDSWDFRYSGPANSVLCDVGLAVFAKYAFWEDFGLTTAMVKAFLTEVADAYPSNPYHSQEHAADVLQSTHVLLMSHGSLRGFLTDVDLFTLMISAVCHDLHHPGVDSTTVKALEPAFARKFGGDAILERAHMILSWPVVVRHFGHLFDSTMLVVIEKLMKRLLLATDTTKQPLLIARLNSTAPDAVAFMSAVLHAADVSNPAKKSELYVKWMQRVMTEFFLQGDLQQAVGLPVSPLCDAEKPCVRQCQLGFINFVVRPIFMELDKIMDVSVQIEHIKKTVATWTGAPDELHVSKIMKLRRKYTAEENCVSRYHRRRDLLLKAANMCVAGPLPTLPPLVAVPPRVRRGVGMPSKAGSPRHVRGDLCAPHAVACAFLTCPPLY
eukprot:Rhum_TRINITY_DN15211_c19_g1::Rhum_TRINITY_DN15211_c19_g1_i1::g.145000::m.145000/K13293/PDE4; cAMP-specific phosphodiesterase 4